MKKRMLFLTGNPGVGKTTVLLRILEALGAKGFNIGGMISREVRSGASRIGFEILDLASDRRGWLAHANQGHGPQIGRYRVNLGNLNSVGATAVVDAVQGKDVVAIDEIGPMELCSEQFRKAVDKAADSNKLVVGTLHWKMRDKLIDELRTREDIEIFTVTLENRENLQETIILKAEEFLAYDTCE